MSESELPRPLRVLHLEDSERDAAMVRDRLQVAGLSCEILLVDGKAGFEAALAAQVFDLIISDYTLPGYDGITALTRAREVQPDVPVILISGTVGDEEAVKCLHIGATDYLLKERLHRLGPAVQRAMKEAAAHRTRQEMEQALRQREQTLSENDRRMAFALGAARIGVWEIDLATNRITWSDTLLRLFGRTPENAPRTKADFFLAIHPEDRPTVEASIEKAIAGGGDCVMEFRTLRPDGTQHWLHGRAQVSHGADGTPLSLLGIGMDIDDRRSLEDQLRQAQKLEAIGQLAGGVAHDFNNVLTVILGFSELLMDSLPADHAAQADLREIKKAGARASGLTRQLLAFGRKQILQPKVLDVNALICGMTPMLRQVIVEHIELTVVQTADAALVKMDPTQLEQIVVNLAVNASDAMPRGGKFSIETAAVTLDEHYQQRQLPVPPGNYVRIVMRDTGVGMDEATIRHIFEPFFTTKEVGKGTGLGLATVHGIVKQSGGDIRVESEPDRGTTFTIYLPQVPTAAPHLALLDRPIDAGAIERGSETVLLVEDDEGVIRLARRTLERIGYRVLEARNPKEAALIASEYTGPIHLLLSDVIMPESEGAPLFGKLVETRPYVRVLYMSGYADEAIRHVLLVDGTPFLQKPFTPQALSQKVRDVLDAAHV
jgi:two-component system cell cycle sensor histidine kinase/response regulator CckA